MKYNTFSAFPVYEKNPFWDGVIENKWIKVRTKKNITEKSVIAIESGDTSDYVEVVKDEFVQDRQPFIKMYKDALFDLKKISTPAGLILFEMLETLENDSDTVRFDIPEFMNKHQYKSKSNVYKGLLWLLQSEFIAKRAGADGLFFINVWKFYVGKREKHPIMEQLIKQIKK